jgi:isocitrate dehydrogenase kinase/phosphatase
MKLFYYISVISLLFGESSGTSANISITTTTTTSRMKSIPRPLVHRMHQLQHDAMDDLLQRTESNSLSSDTSDIENFMKKSTSVSMIPRGGSITLQERLKIGFYFALWYALNIIYNSTSIL